MARFKKLDRVRLRQLAESGKTADQIGRIMGCHPYSVRSLCNKMGITLPRKTRAGLQVSNRAELLACISQPMTELRRKFSASPRTINNWITMAGLRDERARHCPGVRRPSHDVVMAEMNYPSGAVAKKHGVSVKKVCGWRSHTRKYFEQLALRKADCKNLPDARKVPCFSTSPAAISRFERKSSGARV